MRARRGLTLMSGLLSLSLVAAACGGDDSGSTDTTQAAGGSETTAAQTTTTAAETIDYSSLSGDIRIDGSSTVTPLISLAAEDFQAATNGNVRVTVGTSGTGGGFEKFCNDETDISMASREIKQSEIDACAANNIEYIEVVVANDGLSVVVNPENDWATCLTVEELKRIWEPGSTINNWKDVREGFPDQKLVLYGAGTDSGTFDYFTDAIVGEEGASRTDYNPSEDDNVTVTGVAGEKGAMGYFGLSYLLENEGKVKGVEIDGGNGCVAPTTETVQDGSYKPLGRELFIYVKKSSAASKPQVAGFVQYYLENETDITAEALFVPLTEEQIATALEELEAVKGA